MTASSQPFAGIGIANAGREEASGKRQHDKIKHE
jgi:hypothetical protein